MTLTYDEVRDQAQLDTLDDLITDFIEEYHRRGPRPKTGERSTLILFPGGMGSSLLRSKQKFDGTVLPKDAFDEIWLHPRTFAGAATLLGLSCRQSGYRDDHEYPIVAKGAVHLFDETPYTGFGQWCAGHGLGFFTYGYDWRRPYADVARFFVDRFLPRFQERVRCECDYDPLENLILLGHSLGGMVVNWLLRKHHAAMPGLKYAITAATPFYGYGGQVGRWFKGEPLLDHMGTATIVEVVSSLPAMYTLSFLDGKTYDAIEDELAKDCTAPLPAYPSIDYSNNTVRADPFFPASTGNYARYPEQSATGFSLTELANGYAVFKTLSAPMETTLSQKFYNLRGVQSRGGVARERTLGSVFWDWIKPDYDVYRDPCPIKRKPFGKNLMYGDSVIPAWSARLLRADPDERKNNVITVDLDRHEHKFMMEYPPVQDEIGKILGLAAGPLPKREPSDPPEMAPEEDALDFVKDLHHHFRDVRDGPMALTDPMIEDYLRSTGISRARRLPLARRIYVMLDKPVVD